MQHGFRGNPEVSFKSGSKGFGRRGNTITAVKAVDDIQVRYSTDWNNVPLPQNVTVTKGGRDIKARVRWDRGSYNATSTGSYTIVGTILVPEDTNPLGLTADLTVEVLHQAYNDLTNQGFDVAYYDFTRFATGASVAAISNGEDGLRDHGPNGYHATIVNSPNRGRVAHNLASINTLYAVGQNCVSMGTTATAILNQNRVDFFITVLFFDGRPAASANIFGGRSNAGAHGYNCYVDSNGRLHLDVGDGTNSVSLQSTNVLFVNGTTIVHVLHWELDWVANTATLTNNGVSAAVSVIAGSIASIVQANINNSNNFAIGSTNNNGTIGNHPDIIAVERFAMCANITGTEAARIEDYFINYAYPFPYFIVPFMLGDSQSEGASEAGRITAQGIYTITPAEVLIYFKTARTSSDNGNWEGFSGGVNNEIVTGSVISEDVALCTNIRLYSYKNAHIIKAGASGAALDTDWDPVSGNSYEVATQYYWTVGINKLTTANPGKRIKTFISIDLMTNDIADSGRYQNIPTNIPAFISALRAYDSHFETCPIYWCEVYTTPQSGRQQTVNNILRKFCATNPNMYFVSGNPADEISDRDIRIRKIDLTTAQKLSVVATTPGGDDEHRSYLGQNAKGELIFEHLKVIGFI